MIGPEAGKVHGFQADWMIDCYPGSFNVLVSSSHKIFIIYEKQCKKKGIPQSRYA